MLDEFHGEHVRVCQRPAVSSKQYVHVTTTKWCTHCPLVLDYFRPPPPHPASINCCLNESLQVGVAVDMLRSHVTPMRPLDEWLATERRRKAREEAEAKDLEAAAKAQVDRPRQRWCIGSGES